MAALIRFPVEGGGSVLVQEAADPGAGPVRAGRAADVVKEAGTTLQGALAPLRDIARSVLAELREAGPDECAVEFGVGLTAEAGVVVARTEGVAHLTVKLTWKKADLPGAGAPAVMP